MKKIIILVLSLSIIVVAAVFLYSKSEAIDESKPKLNYKIDSKSYNLLMTEKDKLPESMKEKVKLPNKFPYEVSSVKAEIGQMGTSYTTFDIFYNGKKKELIMLRILPKKVESDYSNEWGVKPKNITLKNGSKGTFSKNPNALIFDWVDKDTGIQYMLSFRRENNKEVSDKNLTKEDDTKNIKIIKAFVDSFSIN
ncbi:MAG: hypothetical protein K0S51_1208 [Bacillales bacterium]|jgi:hypothetical protein|nr:hypothetical protein [Bacillales bacterium]